MSCSNYLAATLATAAALQCGAAMAQSTTAGAAPAYGHGPEMAIHTPADIVWKNGPGSLPPGARFAMVEGDATKEGPFTMRLWFPDGFRIQPHWHPKTERITVISGTFNLGMGEAFDAAKTQSMPAGTYGYWEAGMKHFAWTKGETVLQLHGVGPWSITYVNPADDPRNAKK